MNNPTPRASAATDEKRKEIFRRLLTVYWLRPERALWYSHELAHVAEYLSDGWEGPAMEYGCMEGTNTFLMLGGKFGSTHDDYREVSANFLKQGTQKSGDVFDTGDRASEFKPGDIVTPGRAKFDVGISWRAAHLEKARRLGIYERLDLHELNSPLTPYADKSFGLIWATMVFWTDRKLLGPMLADLRRTLMPEGRLITIVPAGPQTECLLFPELESKVPNPEWVKALDRGVAANLLKNAMGLEEWKSIFASQGLKIRRHETFGPSLANQAYQIGFRPFFPALMKMYECLERAGEKSWLEVKEHWIETVYHFLSPMCETEWMHKNGSRDTWFAFELVREEAR